MSTPLDAAPALVLVNLGTPAAPTAPAVRRYLAQFLHDHRVVQLTRWLWCPLLHFIILPLRSPKVAHKYAQIWMAGGSPLAVHTAALADAVGARLPGRRVAYAMRYGEPSVASVFEGLRALSESSQIVAVHDGGRPLITTAQISKCVAIARDKRAVACARPVTETMKRCDDSGNHGITGADRTDRLASHHQDHVARGKRGA